MQSPSGVENLSEAGRQVDHFSVATSFILRSPGLSGPEHAVLVARGNHHLPGRAAVSAEEVLDQSGIGYKITASFRAAAASLEDAERIVGEKHHLPDDAETLISPV
jgi:hypothetical protein